ncbi:MAG: riboflavin biosynthesis protein RibF [Asticcacaulis sp.]|nr:riboflavin biosynthesis protein RibF [Asticcacaulis sp.]
MKPYTLDHQRYHWTVLKPGHMEVVDIAINDDGEVEMFGEIPPGSFASIGSFDGVHIGHARVMQQALDRIVVGPHTVIFFDPHPHSFFTPDTEPFRLSRIQQQTAMFEALEIDYAVIIRFDQNLARMSAEDFARKVLKEALQVVFVGAGFDFNFGARGAGKAQDLVEFGEKYGFDVAILDCQTGADGHKLSSTAVREALKVADLPAVEAILGRPQGFLGEVEFGAQKGRTIGFPTLNMDLGPYQRPKYGVYVSETRLPDGRWFGGVSNIGKRPTVDGITEVFETHLFDFGEDVYGQFIEVFLTEYIRPEIKFASFPELKAQIETDASYAREVCSRSAILNPPKA